MLWKCSVVTRTCCSLCTSVCRHSDTYFWPYWESMCTWCLSRQAVTHIYINLKKIKEYFGSGILWSVLHCWKVTLIAKQSNIRDKQMIAPGAELPLFPSQFCNQLLLYNWLSYFMLLCLQFLNVSTDNHFYFLTLLRKVYQFLFVKQGCLVFISPDFNSPVLSKKKATKKQQQQPN